MVVVVREECAPQHPIDTPLTRPFLLGGQKGGDEVGKSCAKGWVCYVAGQYRLDASLFFPALSLSLRVEVWRDGCR